VPNLVSISESGTCPKSIKIWLDWHPKNAKIYEFGTFGSGANIRILKQSALFKRQIFRKSLSQLLVIIMSKSGKDQPTLAQVLSKKF
jgi:hypothetical protein